MKNTIKIVKFDELKISQPGCARTKPGVGAGACGDVFLPGETGPGRMGSLQVNLRDSELRIKGI